MASLFDIANSGLQAYRKGLSVTGQNIANINTEGLNGVRRTLKSYLRDRGRSKFRGKLARREVESIRRSFDVYLQTRVRTTSAQFEQSNAFVGRIREIENMLLPGDAGLGNFLGSFFGSLQAVASSPADNARVVAVEEGKAWLIHFDKHIKCWRM